MKDRKLRLYQQKKDQNKDLSYTEVIEQFQKVEELKRQHLSGISDKKIEGFLFKTVEQGKGNVSLN